MKGSYDLQKWIMKEYANDSIDFSQLGLAMGCLDFVQSLKRYIQSSHGIEQEIKMEIDKDMATLANKINELIKNIKP